MRIGILGGGQLARMLAMAAHRLGVDPWVVDPKPDAPARVVARHVLASWNDPASLEALVGCDVVTAEFDHAPAAVLARLSDRVSVRPCATAFEIAGDRLREKTLFRSLGIPTAAFAAVDTADDLRAAIAVTGLPAVLKTRREGYDGKGQRLVSSEAEARAAFTRLGGAPALLESVVPFAREISMLSVRGLDGEVRFWSPVENQHRDGILRCSRPLLAPPPRLASLAEQASRALLEAMRYVGVLAVEFFEVDGRLVANEMACRVHNSGHWTEEGAATSQFENHVRAIVGLPLGETESIAPTAMLNLIGTLPARDLLTRLPGARLWLYGKQAAPGRKLGHVTLRARSEDRLERALSGALRLLESTE